MTSDSDSEHEVPSKRRKGVRNTDKYKKKNASVNNFGIHNLGENSCTCYVYHEGITRKTPDDVCSFLNHYLLNFVRDKTYKELHLFADNCAGQNKNHALVRFVMALVE
uniref:Uncharacterized protein n=1 Tax=Cacopsylla melanoneura TaxID=428564 RepID=A0A8D8VSE6_9HEMI